MGAAKLTEVRTGATQRKEGGTAWHGVPACLPSTTTLQARQHRQRTTALPNQLLRTTKQASRHGPCPAHMNQDCTRDLAMAANGAPRDGPRQKGVMVAVAAARGRTHRSRWREPSKQRTLKE